MVTLRKFLKFDDMIKECSVELTQDGKCYLVVDSKVVAKYSSLENCLFNHNFVDVFNKYEFEKFEEI